MPTTQELKDAARRFVVKWNVEHPVDYRWRKHFNIPFGSKEHLDADFIDQEIWYEEFQLIKELSETEDAKLDENGRVIIETDTISDEGFMDMSLDMFQNNK